MDKESEPRPFCFDSVATLICLAVQLALALCLTVFLDLIPDWFGGLQNLIVVTTTALGGGCAVGAVRQRGWMNRGVGIIGIIWFAFVITLAFGAFLKRV